MEQAQAVHTPETGASRSPSARSGGGPATGIRNPVDGFSARLLEVIAELVALGETPLRLADIDARLTRFGQIEDEFLISNEQYQNLDYRQRAVFDAFLQEYHKQSTAVRFAHSAPGVIEDAMLELETAWRSRQPGTEPDRAPVLAVARRCSETGLLAIAISSSTVLPRGASRSHGTRLLRCEQWLFGVLAESVSTGRLRTPLTGFTEDEYEAILSLWEEDPTSEFHDPGSVLEAVRRLS